MKLIDKDALVAEIEKLMNRYDSEYDEDSTEVKAAKGNVCHEILCTIDTLEVKGVDLEKAIDFAMPSKYCWSGDGEAVYTKKQMRKFAKHFFELGLNASNPLTWEDVKEICVQSVLVEIDLGGKVSDERHYTEVLKRFKDLKHVK